MANDDPAPSPTPAAQPGAQPPAQAAPAQATLVPKLPLYITTMTPSKNVYGPVKKGDPPNPDPPETADPIQWNGSDIPLYTFSFLGKSSWTPYTIKNGADAARKVAGVNFDLAKRLIAAQSNLYWKALAEAQEADPKVVELTEAQFGAWCWSYQEPLQNGVPSLGQVQGTMGYKDASNPASFHSSGSAIDINLMFNPYLPTRNGTYISGEPQSYAKDFAKANPQLAKDSQAKHDLHVQKIWGPAIDVFDRAYSLSYGTPSDTSANLNRSQAGASYERFKRLSVAVQTYFRYAYTDGTGGGDPQPKSQTEFASEFGRDLDDPESVIDPNATFNGQNLKSSMVTNRTGTLQALYDQIIQDLSAFRAGCVSGKITINADLSITLPNQRQRDPCKGVFNVRREVFMELVVEQKLAWGGCMFGNKSGADTMHFDMNAHWVNGTEVKSPYRN